MEEEERRREHEAMMEELRRICNDDIYEYRTLEIREVEGGRGIVCLLQFLFLLVLLCFHTKPSGKKFLGFSHVVEMKIDNCDVNDEHLRKMGSMQIRKLELVLCQFLTAKGLQYTSNFAKSAGHI